jgi:hypothetical protein
MNKHNSLVISNFFLFVIVCNLCTETKAGQLCPALKGKINFSVTVIPKNINYKLDLKQKQINQLTQGKFKKRSNQRALGLTSTKQSVSTKMRGQTKQISSHLYCTRVTSANIEIKVLKLNVYVLGKYPRGSCQYSAIIDHEHEHVATFQTGISNLERVFNSQLWEIVRNLPPGIGSTPEKSGSAAFKSLEEQITALRLPVERTMKHRDRQIDTPLSYRLLTQQCARW